MKTRQSLSNWLLTCGLALVAVVAAQTIGAQSVKDGKATVKFVSGTVKCAGADGAAVEVKKDMEIPVGATIQTSEAEDSYVDLRLNGETALLRVAPGTTVKVEKMAALGDTDTDTTLDLKEGSVLGSVKKLSKASHFDVKVANGVAGIRGTDFGVTVKKLTTGNFEVTFACVQGEVVATAIIPGRLDPITNVLRDRQSWTPGREVVTMTPVELQRFIRVLKDLLPDVKINIITPPPQGNPHTDPTQVSPQ